MSLKVALATSIVLVTSLMSQPASAAPISSCVVTDGGVGNTCELYEEDANGNPSDIGWVIDLPYTPVVAGYVVLLENGSDPNNVTDQQNLALWSDVLVFTSTTVQLLSDGCGSCFPSLADVLGTTHSFIVEDATGVTTWTPDLVDSYTVHSDGVPEPATLLLFGTGAVALFRKARARRTQA